MNTLIEFFQQDLIFLNAIRQNWSQGSFSYIKSSRPNYGITLVISGQIDYVSNGKTLSVKPGDLIFLPKNCYYKAIFHIKNSDVNDFLVNFDAPDYVKTFGIPDTPTKIGEGFGCFDLFEQLIEGRFGIKRTKNYLKGLFCLLLDEIVVKYIQIGQSVNPVIEKAQRLLIDNSRMSIKEIARLCNVSESSLRKMFKNTVGISPVQYRTDAQINKAKYLIESTGMSIEEISDMLGFYDAAYFCKIFRSRVGFTPKKYSLSKKL